MLNEPTTIASVARLIGETLQAEYAMDPAPLYRELNIDTTKFFRPGSRIVFSKMDGLWSRSAELTEDPEFGLKVGARAGPGDFFVLGHAWLASDTLHDAMQRLCRFINVLSTIGSHMYIRPEGDSYVLVETGDRRLVGPQQVAMDAGHIALLRLCDFVTSEKVRPQSVALPQSKSASSVDYERFLECPVSFDAEAEVWTFASPDIEAPLSGAVPDVADATDRIAENYIASIDEGAVAHDVRQALIQALPSGHVDQESIANKLYRSRSTLQRQLGVEGTNYREILESTRQALAEKYLQGGEYTQAQVAFMVGFSDQSNFARAFKRWTGMSPGEFQKAA
jgi:AraC-like DNA-binding protein